MAERLASTGSPFELHYCTRSAERTAFVERIGHSSFAGRAHVHHDEGPGQRRLALDKVLADCPGNTHLYVCGPSGFMDWVLDTAIGSGWREDQLHREYFAATPVAADGDRAFEVQIASTGAVIPVPADRSVVASLAEAGISVPVSCEQGVCGTCLVRVLEGTPDHRDVYLTHEEQAQGSMFLPCCSRSNTPRLVLDL
jgi:vanillate O-demethylase ferredoxin subunit